MKTLGLIASLLVLGATGCGNDNSGAPDMTTTDTPDQSVSSALDLSATNNDLATLTGCRGLELCYLGCQGNAGCQMTCRMNATTAGRKLARKLNDCRQVTCYAQDGGAAPCMMGVAPSAACTSCLKDTITMAGMCAAGGTPSWCGACYAEYTACAADLP